MQRCSYAAEDCKRCLSAQACLEILLLALMAQGIKKLKNQPMVGFNARTDGLQINVGFGGLQDKVLRS